MNYYVVLGVDEGADPETIRRAFRGLVRRYHPDAGEGSSSDAFRCVVAAYETLGDPVRRRVYDCSLQRERALKTTSPTLRRVVEPLGNRTAAEPIASHRFASRNHRGPMDVVRWSIDVDELFEELVCFVEMYASSGYRSR